MRRSAAALCDDVVVSFPAQRRKAKATPDELAALLASLDIKIIDRNDYRHANCTTAVETLRGLLAKYGPEHLTIVLRTITESAECNAQALIDPVIRAISAVVLAHPEWAATGLRWIEVFDGVDLLDWYTAGSRLKKTAAAPGWAFLAGMLVIVLRHEFGGPRKRHRTRAEIAAAREDREEAERARVAAALVDRNRRKIEIGQQLIEMKRTAGRGKFLRLARQRHGLEYSGEIGGLMRVAALYGARPQVWQCVSWQVLHAIAEPSMPDELRSEIEARIEAGERVLVKDVVAARAALQPAPIGRPRRR